MGELDHIFEKGKVKGRNGLAVHIREKRQRERDLLISWTERMGLARGRRTGKRGGPAGSGLGNIFRGKRQKYPKGGGNACERTRISRSHGGQEELDWELRESLRKLGTGLKEGGKPGSARKLEARRWKRWTR